MGKIKQLVKCYLTLDLIKLSDAQHLVFQINFIFHHQSESEMGYVGTLWVLLLRFISN